MIMGIQSFFLFFIFYKQLQLGSDKADGTFNIQGFTYRLNFISFWV